MNSSGATPSTAGSEYALFSVLCYHDFHSNEPDHLRFSRNEIIDIIKQEGTGWWAAMRKGGDAVGWIPEAFVKPLSDEMSERLLRVREELRCFEYDAEQLYNDAPISQHATADGIYDEPEPSPSTPPPEYEADPPPVAQSNGQNRPVRPLPQAGGPPPSQYNDAYFVHSPRSTSIPPSPVTPMPHPPVSFDRSGKTAPPTPLSRAPSLVVNGGNRRWRESSISASDVEALTLNNAPDTFIRPPSIRGRPDKVERLTGDVQARNFLRAQIAVPSTFSSYSQRIVLDGDEIRWGTLDDLILRLTYDSLAKDPIKIAAQNQFQSIFLTTFRTFINADLLFKKLVDRYYMTPPNELAGEQLADWKEKVQLPTQRKVLNIFTMWLEKHRLLEEEPEISRWMTEFLRDVKNPKLVPSVKFINQTIERLTFASPKDSNIISSPRKRKKSKSHKGDLLRMDPADLAEQLSLFEHRLYAKITAQECLAHPRANKAGVLTPNLTSFCSTYDQLANWVKTSILNNEQLGRRADMVDFWIKVSEKSRYLNNFASMSSIINALSSSDVTRLHLTWAHINRKSQLDALLRFNEPTGGWSGYRSLLAGAEGPCVPFIGMYLTDLVHISDQFKDEEDRICFAQRQRWYEVISSMLKFQSRPYPVAEGSTQTFILAQLRMGMMKDRQWFYTRSQEVQQSELANADIRKGLEAAGF